MAELLDPKQRNPEFNFAKKEDDKVAIPWAAPECLKNQTASPKSDVWSMGVTMWEFLSRCEKFPHEELCREENFQRKLITILDSKKDEYCHKEVKKSKRKTKNSTSDNAENPNKVRLYSKHLARPQKCSLAVYNKVLVKCWELDQSDRVSAKQMEKTLAKIRENPTKYHIYGMQQKTNQKSVFGLKIMSVLTYLSFFIMFGLVLFTGPVTKFFLNGVSHKLAVPRLYRPEMEFRNRFCDQDLDPKCANKTNPGVGITQLMLVYIEEGNEQNPERIPDKWNNKRAKEKIKDENKTDVEIKTETGEYFCENSDNCDYEEYMKQKRSFKGFKDFMQSVDFHENGTLQSGYTRSELCYFEVNNSDPHLTPVRRVPAKNDDGHFTLIDSPIKSKLKDRNPKGRHNYCNFKTTKIDQDHALYVLAKQKNKGELLLDRIELEIKSSEKDGDNGYFLVCEGEGYPGPLRLKKPKNWMDAEDKNEKEPAMPYGQYENRDMEKFKEKYPNEVTKKEGESDNSDNDKTDYIEAEFTPTVFQYCQGQREVDGSPVNSCNGKWVALRCSKKREKKKAPIKKEERKPRYEPELSKKNITRKKRSLDDEKLVAEDFIEKCDKSDLELINKGYDSNCHTQLKKMNLTIDYLDSSDASDIRLYSQSHQIDTDIILTIPTNAKVLQSTKNFFYFLFLFFYLFIF